MKSRKTYTDEIKELRERSEKVTSSILSVQQEKMRALSKAEKEISGKFTDTIEELSETRKSINSKTLDACIELHDYASFPTREINLIFSICLTYIEGEPFMPYWSDGHGDFHEGKTIATKAICDNFGIPDYDAFDKLNELGQTIMLEEGIGNPTDLYDFSGEPNYAFGPYEYLERFTDQLIQYRIDKDIKYSCHVSFDDLFSELTTFLLRNPGLALKNIEKRDKLLFEEDNQEYIVELCRKMSDKFSCDEEEQ